MVWGSTLVERPCETPIRTTPPCPSHLPVARPRVDPETKRNSLRLVSRESGGVPGGYLGVWFSGDIDSVTGRRARHPDRLRDLRDETGQIK